MLFESDDRYFHFEQRGAPILDNDRAKTCMFTLESVLSSCSKISLKNIEMFNV